MHGYTLYNKLLFYFGMMSPLMHDIGECCINKDMHVAHDTTQSVTALYARNIYLIPDTLMKENIN